jgi:hypothetical protein
MDEASAEELIVGTAVDGLGALAPDRWPRPAKVLVSAVETAGSETPPAQAHEDGVLVPIYEAGYPEQVVVTDRITLLARFLTLADTTDVGAFARFARRWGMLGLCPAHDLPYWHEPGGCGPRIGAPETVASWRFYAKQAARMLTLGQARRRNDLNGNDLNDLNGNDLRVRAELEGTVARWLRWSGVTPHLAYEEVHDRYRVELGSGSLFGQLAVLLLYAATGGGPRLLPCAGGCGRWIAPKGRERYCATCGKRARERLARARYRARNRADPDRPRQPRGRGVKRG